MAVQFLRPAWTAALGVIIAGVLAMPTSVFAQLQPIPSAPVITTVPATVGNDYWIVSSRRCRECLDCGQQCAFDVWHFDCHGHGVLRSLDDLYASLVPGTPTCFMLHGSFVEWDSVLKDSVGTNTWIRSVCPDRPLHIVFYTWPSDEAPAIRFTRDVMQLGRRAERNSLYVAELISRVPDHHPICLLGHSHGARMTLATLHVLGGGEVDGTVFAGGGYHQHRIRAVLAAAAADHDWLNQGALYGRAVCRAESIVNLLSRKDLALKFYPLHRPFCTRALARIGFTDKVRQSIGPYSAKLADFDVTPFVGYGHVWAYYYQQPYIAQAISTSVFFPDVVTVATQP
ncbi:MAG TPA: hypothetical protein VFG20_05335 [Planctomycetaceae bacterium]|nr:hypothetical protein [Planctomycetaceae bacterium]